MKIQKWKRLVAGMITGAVGMTMLPYSGMTAVAESWKTAVSEVKQIAEMAVTDSGAGNTYTAAGDYITRGEWIHTLVDAFEMGVEDESTMEEYFTDIAGNQYETDINLAANYGVFDIDSETFVPDDYVSREFMAHTMNFCLGFADDVTPTFTDASEVYYAGDAQVAVDRGWLELVNGEFEPDAYVVQSEADAALADMRQIFDETDIAETEETVDTAASVIAIEDTAQVVMSGTSVTITGSAKTVQEGDTISFPLEGNTLVRKVTSCSVDEADNTMHLEVEMPEEDALGDVVASGYGYIDYDNIEVLSDDFELEVLDDEETVVDAPVAIGPTRQIGVYGWSKEDTVNVPTKKLRLKSKTFNVGGGKVTVSGGLDSLKVPYKLKMSALNVKQLKVGVDAEASLTAKFTTEMSSASGEIQILKIPVYSAGVASIVVTVSISISVKGEVSITYSCGANGSIEYTKKNGWRFEKSFKSKGFTMEASVEEKIGIKLALKVDTPVKTLGEVYFSFGEKGKAAAKRYSDGFTCVDISAYIYAEFGLKFALPKYSKTWTLIDASNSPFYLHQHYDNDEKVKSCTYGKSDGSSYVGSKTEDGGTISQKGRVVYSGASGNIKRAKGKSSSKWTSSYTSYTQAFAELTPPAEINEATTLTEDTTYPYGLIINADLDLNGHKLTVKGDVKHNHGTVNFNKGTMTISGDYTSGGWSFPILDMDYKEDTFVVEGTCSMGRDGGRGKLEAIAGTCEFKGDFYSYFEFLTSDLHKTIFSGTKDQTIYCKNDGDSYFNVVEIKNTDSRKILIESYFLVQKAITCDGDKLSLVGSDTISSDTAFIKLSSCAVENLTIDGDCTLSNLDYTGKKVTVNGNVTVPNERTVNMNGCTWVNNGNLTLGESSWRATFIVGGGNLTVNGDLCNNTNTGLTMTNKKDDVTVTGDFLVKFENDSGRLTNGIMYIGGDIYATSDIYATENHQIILTGKNDQNLYMENADSYINYLKIENSGSRKFTVDGYFRCDMIDCGEESLNLITNDIPGNVGSFSFGTLTCSDLNIEGDVNFYGNNIFKGKNITVNGSCTLQNWRNEIFDIGDATMTVKGDMIENEGEFDREYVKIGGGKLIVEGNYQQNNGILHITSGTVSVAGDAIFNGSIIMDKDDSLLTIAGDMDNNLQDYTSLTAGTIELVGNMTSTSGYLRSSGTFKMVLAGAKDQSLKLDPTVSGSNIGFATLEVKNSDIRKLILQNRLSTGDIICDGKAINIVSNGGAINKMKLRCPINITGDIVVRGNASENIVDLNGNTMTIDGNLYQYGSTIQPNTGKLTVTKNYLMVTEEDSAVYGTSSGILSMTNKGDYVSVGGDFITNTEKNHEKYLTAGLMEIKGDFHQMADGTTFAFPASGTHQVLLSGDKTQNVTFDSYSDSHFNILALDQPESQYVFNENPCWNEKVSGSDVTTETTPAATTTETTAATTTEPDATTDSDNTTTEPDATTDFDNTTTEPDATTDSDNTTIEPDTTTDSDNTTTEPDTTTDSDTTTTETTETSASETTSTQTEGTPAPIELAAGETLTQTAYIGDAVQLKLPEDVTAVSWVSSKPDVVSIDADGNCKVLGEGDALLIGTDSTGTVYMLDMQCKPTSSEPEISFQMKDYAYFITCFYVSEDERAFDPQDFFDYVTVDGEDVTDQITLSWLGLETPRDVYNEFDSAYVEALELDVYYQGQALTDMYGCCVVNIGVKGDTNLNGKVDQIDAYNTLIYSSHMALGDTSYQLTDGSSTDLELLAHFLSDVDTECATEADGKISQNDAYYILLMSSYVSLGEPISWIELLPSLAYLENSYWWTL